MKKLIYWFFIYGIDKFLVFKHYYRISEKLLYLFSIHGGVLDTLLRMFFFRHKILKLKFYFIKILSLILWNLLLCIYLDKDLFEDVKKNLCCS